MAKICMIVSPWNLLDTDAMATLSGMRRIMTNKPDRMLGPRIVHKKITPTPI